MPCLVAGSKPASQLLLNINRQTYETPVKIIYVAIILILFNSGPCARATAQTLLIDNPTALLGCAGRSAVRDASPAENLKQLARDAIASDTSVSRRAIESLRARGPEGLQALFDEHAELLKSVPSPLSTTGERGANEKLFRLKSALDAVGQQRDCYASGLYWYTDFEQVKAAAKSTGKPILSLRLLGNLDEEFSCANSRFFRTTLYANKEVSAYLRDRFVLHWKSVRPVPKVTIDFGDGRKLERTITGNSIHYVLDAEGRVIDALPGLYGPKAFLQGLQHAEQIAQRSASVNTGQRQAMLGEYHRARFAALNSELGAALQKVSAANSTVPSMVTITPASLLSEPPSAQTSARVTASKYRVERPILDNSLPRPAQNENGPAGIDDATWSKIAALHEESSKLDAAARALIRAKSPTAFDARRAAFAKMIVEDPLLRQIRNLERSISEDTARNEYLLHPRIHAWLANGEMTNVDELNRKVYTELFLTPDSDPWLGLVPRDTYTALENGGLIQPVRR